MLIQLLYIDEFQYYSEYEKDDEYKLQCLPKSIAASEPKLESTAAASNQNLWLRQSQRQSSRIHAQTRVNDRT